ncbi:MAG: hypothetical protein CM1200mP14_17410 [Gammaproteobacteria bacterium]|nr:MAG: hypothetical protein CM1200mP14_17410 [Gammaproteobacteria bacterium]
MAHTESMSAPKDRIRVVAAVIQRDGRFLVCQRSHLKRHGGLWEFPGGKIELSETIEAATERELKEELALEVTGIGRTLLIQMDPGSPFQIEFVEVFAEGDPRALGNTKKCVGCCHQSWNSYHLLLRMRCLRRPGGRPVRIRA